MNIAFANNQVLIAGSSDPCSITTDPVALGDADRVLPMVNVHMINGTSPSFDVQAEVSNDGQNWADSGSAQPFDSQGDGQLGTVITAEAAWVRFRFDYTVGSAGPNWVIFDLHCRIFKV